MTTKRHARYLREYPEKIALKRRKRRHKARRAVAGKRASARRFREMVQDIRFSRPASAPIRAAKPGMIQKIKEFLKPSV